MASSASRLATILTASYSNTEVLLMPSHINHSMNAGMIRTSCIGATAVKDLPVCGKHVQWAQMGCLASSVILVPMYMILFRKRCP